MVDDDEHVLIHGLVDGELDDKSATALRKKMKTNKALGAQFAVASAVKVKLNQMPKPEVSDALLGRIINAPQATPVRSKMFEGWQRMAASMLLVAGLSSAVTYGLLSKQGGLDETDAIAASHRRSLLAASPIDVATADSHTVKPWFDAHIGLSPPVVDLKDDGFNLLGGRVDVIGERTVPTLVYQHKEHLISVFAEPLRSGEVALQSAKHVNAGGMQMVRMSANGFSYWFVSDMEWPVLDGFVADYRAHLNEAPN